MGQEMIRKTKNNAESEKRMKVEREKRCWRRREGEQGGGQKNVKKNKIGRQTEKDETGSRRERNGYSDEKILSETLVKLEKRDDIKSATLYGLTSLGESAMNYLVGISCEQPADKLRLRRLALKTIIKALEDNKISIPYPQLDVHTKKQPLSVV